MDAAAVGAGMTTAPRGSVASGLDALREWKLILLLTLTTAVLGLLSAMPLAAVFQKDLAGTLVGDHFIRNFALARADRLRRLRRGEDRRPARHAAHRRGGRRPLRRDSGVLRGRDGRGPGARTLLLRAALHSRAAQPGSQPPLPRSLRPRARRGRRRLDRRRDGRRQEAPRERASRCARTARPTGGARCWSAFSSSPFSRSCTTSRARPAATRPPSARGAPSASRCASCAGSG